MSLNKRLLFCLIAGIVALLCAVTIARATFYTIKPRVLWSTDHENSEVDWWSPGGINHGGGEFDSGCAGTAPSQDVARSGSFSLKLTMGAPCGTVLESGTRMFRWLEPQQYPDLYYKVWYYFPLVYTITGNGVDPDPWWNIFQWKSQSTNPPRNDAFFSVNIANGPNGNMYLYLRDSHTGSSYVQAMIDVPVGQWFYIEAFYKSRGDNTGQVTIWQNGTLLWDLTGVQTRYPDIEGGTTAWSVNNYSNGVSPQPAIFYIDDAEIRAP